MLLLAAAFVFATSLLPITQPGLSRYEGAFLVTQADDGSRATYFVAQGSRHSILESDLQSELHLNPLWPVLQVDRELALGIPEGPPIGQARTGRLTAPPTPAAEPTIEATPEIPSTDEVQPDDSPAAGSPRGPEAAWAAPEMVLPASTPSTHTVRRGENLITIAARYGLDWMELAVTNGLANPNKIYAGQVLLLGDR